MTRFKVVVCGNMYDTDRLNSTYSYIKDFLLDKHVVSFNTVVIDDELHFQIVYINDVIC